MTLIDHGDTITIKKTDFVRIVLASLTPHERLIVGLRNGFGAEKIHTLQQIARRLRVSHQAIAASEKRAEKKLAPISPLCWDKWSAAIAEVWAESRQMEKAGTP